MINLFRKINIANISYNPDHTLESLTNIKSVVTLVLEMGSMFLLERICYLYYVILLLQMLKLLGYSPKCFNNF